MSTRTTTVLSAEADLVAIVIGPSWLKRNILEYTGSKFDHFSSTYGRVDPSMVLLVSSQVVVRKCELEEIDRDIFVLSSIQMRYECVSQGCILKTYGAMDCAW